MSYAKKRRKSCEAEHPRRGIKCWGGHETGEPHNATVMTKSGLQTVTWVD